MRIRAIKKWRYKLVLEVKCDLDYYRRIVERVIFEYCYKKYYKYILSYCRTFYKLSAQEEDVVQDAFMLFWAKGIRRVNLMKNPESYIRAIMRNLIYHLRCGRRHESFNEELHSGSNPYAVGLGFYELISALSKEEQHVVELCYLHGYDREEAARQAHISRRTCFRRLENAKRKLRRGYQ
jgi:DNA-directed RNA polymerase specialized sigma24 family protein